MAKVLRGKPSNDSFRASLQRSNVLVIVGSVLFCALLQPHRIPGMVFLDTAPNWFLIWVVTWSVKRSPWQGAVAGLILGLLQDGLTTARPTHALSLGLVGFLTSRLDKQRFIEEDFISVLLLVFVMAILGEAIFAGQLALGGEWLPSELWIRLQRVALSSAIISSLWTPLLYVPLNVWWTRLHRLMNH